MTEDLYDDFCALIIIGGPIGAYEKDKFPFLEKEIEIIKPLLREEKGF